MEQMQNQYREVFPNAWAFTQTSQGYVILNVVTPNGIAPCLLFVMPETLLNFQKDLNTAVERFIPLPVRQAAGILDKAKWGGEDGNEPGATGEAGSPVPEN